MDRILESFLTRQQEDALALAAESDILRLAVLDGPPARHYIASFSAKGLIQDPSGQIVEANRFDVGIRLPETYLRQASSGDVLTYLGPQWVWHPNIRPPFVCVRIHPGSRLVDLLYVVYELLTWRTYATNDPLNPAAGQWALRQGAGRFPTDRRPLKRRRLNVKVATAEEARS